MITSDAFFALRYTKPHLNDERPRMPNIQGIDSEAYLTGEPFMLATSERRVIKCKRGTLKQLTQPEFHKVNFVTFNLKYDSGAILYELPMGTLDVLRDQGEVEWHNLKFKYIPHKFLRIIIGTGFNAPSVTFWDIAQFYHSTLDKAAKTYLGQSKDDIETKTFNAIYVHKKWHRIAKYCIQDATLTRDLAIFLLDKFETFGITTSTIYSCASVTFKYFCNVTKPCTVWRYWESAREVLRYASDAYAGGKFEITQRGNFDHAYEYDITSAYPYEIANLVDIEDADASVTNDYQPEAVYGFVRCIVSLNNLDHPPCGLKADMLVYYPIGAFATTITKREYEYLVLNGASVEIVSAIWLFVKKKTYPYRKAIQNLFKIKSDAKGKDRMVYQNAKVLMNSFYGKLAQVTPQPDGTFRAGAGWHPIHASVITANTRLKVTAVQNLLKDRCLAVHTDSVMTLDPISDDLVTNALGGFEYVTEGRLTLIACGVYQLNETCAFKGIRSKKISTDPDVYEKWREIFERNPALSSIPYQQLRVESWREAASHGHPKAVVNKFVNVIKNIDLNGDTKRHWPSTMTAGDLLTRNEYGLPRFEGSLKIPRAWSRKSFFTGTLNNLA